MVAPAELSCEKCGKIFGSASALKTHTVTQHEKGVKVKCEICGREFLNMYSLRGHKSEVHNLKKYQCSKCPNKFARIRNYTDHLMEKHGLTVEGVQVLVNGEGEDGITGIMPLRIVKVVTVNGEQG